LAMFAAIRRDSSWVSGLAADSAGFVLKYRRLAPFPFAGVPIVAGDAALDHFVAPLVARHDEGSEEAATEAKRTEGHQDDELQQLTPRTSSGSLAMFAAIRRASSLVSSLVAESPSRPQGGDVGSVRLNTKSSCHGSFLCSAWIPHEIYSDNRTVVCLPAGSTISTALTVWARLFPNKYKPRYVPAMILTSPRLQGRHNII